MSKGLFQVNKTKNDAKPVGSCRCKTAMGFAGDMKSRSGCEQAFPTQRHTSAPFTPPKISLGHIPAGWRGTQKTVEHIQALIRAGAKDFYVRQKAIDILLEKQVKPKDYLAEIKALFEWVQQHIRYTKDTFQVEVLHSAKRMLELRAGDCDDMAILLGAMLEAIGHPVRLALSGPNPLRQDLFTHIYLEVFHKGRWIPLDATMPYPMGWAPRTMVKKIIAIERRSNMMAEDMELQGIGGVGAVPDWLKGLLRTVRTEAVQPKRCEDQNAMGSATATAIAAPKPMAQGGTAPDLEPWAVRSASPAHSASDKTEAAALGNFATEISECDDGASPGSHPPCSPSRCPGGSARDAQTSRVGAACAMQPVRPVQMQPAGTKAVRK